MKSHIYYCCPKVSCDRARLLVSDTGLYCPAGHNFPFIEGTKAPIFACEDEDNNDYTLKDAAIIHDNGLNWVFKTFNTNESTLRNNLISRLHLSKGNRILVTGVGAGNDLPYLVNHLGGDGVIYAQDISKQMLRAAIERSDFQEHEGIEMHFSVSDATDLPFLDDFFDAAYHFGGLNLFPDIRKGISEMDRVVKPGGRLVISDEGLAPWLKETEFGKMLIKNNPLYAFDVPLSLIPSTARSVTLSWELNHCFYVIDYIVSNALPDIDIDVPHLGTRGGSIRKRYFGQLEGVDPILRDKLYAEAEKRGMSRVEYLEKLLHTELA